MKSGTEGEYSINVMVGDELSATSNVLEYSIETKVGTPVAGGAQAYGKTKWDSAWGECPYTDEELEGKFFAYETHTINGQHLFVSAQPVILSEEITATEGTLVKRFISADKELMDANGHLLTTEYIEVTDDENTFATYSGDLNNMNLSAWEMYPQDSVSFEAKGQIRVANIYVCDAPKSGTTKIKLTRSVKATGIDDGSVSELEQTSVMEYGGLDFEYTGDEDDLALAALASYSSAMMNNAIATIESGQGSARVGYFSIRPTSTLLNDKPDTYSYGADVVYMNNKMLEPGDYSWAFPMDSTKAAPTSWVKIFIEPPTDGVSGDGTIIAKEDFAATIMIKTVDNPEWHAYATVGPDVIVPYGNQQYNVSYSSSLKALGDSFPNDVYAWKLSYDFSGFDCVYKIDDDMFFDLYLNATPHTQEIMASSPTRSLQLGFMAFIEKEHSDDESYHGATRSEHAALGTVTNQAMISDMEAYDQREFGYLPFRKGVMDSLCPWKNPQARVCFSGTSVEENDVASQSIKLISSMSIGQESGAHYGFTSRAPEEIKQYINHGAFTPITKGSAYVLLPLGASFGKVENIQRAVEDPTKTAPVSMLVDIDETSIGIEQHYNWNGSGRTLVKIDIALPKIDPSTYWLDKTTTNWAATGSTAAQSNYAVGDNRFVINFSTSYPYEAMSQYGTTYHIDAAFQSDQYEGFAGTIADTGKWNGWDSDTQSLFANLSDGAATPSLYAYINTPISVETSYTAGPRMTVSSDMNAAYGESTSAHLGEKYSYRLVYRTSTSGTQSNAKDLVFYDVLDESGNSDSAWNGTFDSIDTTQARLSGCYPVIYWSQKKIDLEDDGDKELSDASIWHEGEPSDADKSKVASVAIDFRYANEDRTAEFHLAPGRFVEALVNMTLPTDSDKIGQVARNSHFVTATVFSEHGDAQGYSAPSNIVSTEALGYPFTVNKEGAVIDAQEDDASLAEISYIIEVSNASYRAYDNVTIKDPLPAGLSVKEGSVEVKLPGAASYIPVDESGCDVNVGETTIELSTPNISGMGTLSIRFTALAERGGQYDNTASVTGYGEYQDDEIEIPSNTTTNTVEADEIELPYTGSNTFFGFLLVGGILLIAAGLSAIRRESARRGGK